LLPEITFYFGSRGYLGTVLEFQAYFNLVLGQKYLVNKIHGKSTLLAATYKEKPSTT